LTVDVLIILLSDHGIFCFYFSRAFGKKQKQKLLVVVGVGVGVGVGSGSGSGSGMSLTIEDIENRNYTFVSVLLDTVDPTNGIIANEKFLVHSPYKGPALNLAKEYVEKHGLTLRPWNQSNACKCCGCFHLYPRNYIAKARELFAEGKYI